MRKSDPSEKEMPPELYRIAEKLEKLPKTKRKIVYSMLENMVDVAVCNHKGRAKE